MKIPHLSKHVEIEILPGYDRATARGAVAWGRPTVALRATARVNGDAYCVIEEVPVDLLDEEGYGRAVFEKLSREIGRKVVFG